MDIKVEEACVCDDGVCRMLSRVMCCKKGGCWQVGVMRGREEEGGLCYTVCDRRAFLMDDSLGTFRERSYTNPADAAPV